MKNRFSLSISQPFIESVPEPGKWVHSIFRASLYSNMIARKFNPKGGNVRKMGSESNENNHLESHLTHEKIKKQRIQEAEAKRQAGYYEGALVLLEQAQELDDNDASIYRLKAEILYDLQQYEKSLVAFENVLRYYPDDTEANQKKRELEILLGKEVAGSTLLKDLFGKDAATWMLIDT